MQEQLSEVLFYIKGTLKYKWAIIIVAWLVCLSGWIFVSTMPDEYQSKAVVSVDSRTMLQPLLRGIAIQSSTRGMIQVMRQLMFTRPKLEKVAQLADLNIDSKNESQKQSIIGNLKDNIRISGGKGDLFSISYEGSSAAKSQNIVHAVLTVFSEQAHLRGGSGDTDNAQQFIDEQIREYEIRLQNAEQARENFKRVNSGFLPNQGGESSGGITQLKVQLAESNLALSEISSRWRVIKRQMNEVLETDEDSWSIADYGGASSPEDSKISLLEARKDELLLKFTINHPDVLSIKASINDLINAKRQRLANQDHNIMSTGAISNPYVQSLKISLNQIESERASIRSRIGILNQRLANHREGMDARLHIETEMQGLDRDYSIIKSNYMKLIARREQASLTEKADMSQGVLRFKIVEAPSVPLEPSAPNRELLNSMVLIGSILIGIAIAFLIYFIRPTFMSTHQVRSVTGLPVLGSVSVQLKAGEKPNKTSKTLFLISTSSLILVYILIMSMSLSKELSNLLSSL